MDIENGLNQLKQKIDKRNEEELSDLQKKYAYIKSEVAKLISTSGAYLPIDRFLEKIPIPQRESEPEGFFYGFRTPPKEFLPKIYEFQNENATAIAENSGCAHLLFNYALRSIVSYQLGDCNVYMVDSNVSGDFNQLSKISTSLSDNESEKPFFHYITRDDERQSLLSELELLVDANIRTYKNLREYNKNTPLMHQPYHFVFIKNIMKTYPEKSQIERIEKLIRDGNAQKAGIFIFYTYDSNDIGALSDLLRQSRKQEPKTTETKASINIVEKVITYVGEQEIRSAVVSFKDQIEKELAKGSLWDPPFERKKGHLSFKLGFKNAQTPMEIDVNFLNDSPHIFIGGKTGTGKSILLHNFITNGSLRYSPEQLRFYLVDMKGGVSFAPYKTLPHIAALSASSDREYAMSLLELFCEENAKRQSVFKSVGSTNLDGYNDLMTERGMKPMPYLFGIIDEFQELFKSNDTISRNAGSRIEEIHKQGRASGISLILCTQETINDISRTQVGIKIALRCGINDSNLFIGNDGAARLRGIGRAIANTSETGEERFNEEFVVAYIDEKKELPKYVEAIREIYQKQNGGTDASDHLVYDDNDLSAQLPLWMEMEMNSQKDQQFQKGQHYIYIGIPRFFRKEHVKFRFHRDYESNLVMAGSDWMTAIRLTGIVATQFLSLYNDSKVYISDLQSTENATYGKLECLTAGCGVSYTRSKELESTLNEVYQILCMRKEDHDNGAKEPEILYALFDLKQNRSFTNQQSYLYDDENEQKNPIAMLKELIDEGPDYGIHILVYGYSYEKLSSLLDESINNMEVKIGLRGASAKALGLYGGNTSLPLKEGQGFIRMPETMGLKYHGEDDLGDPFLVYNVLENKQPENKLLGILFDNLNK